MKKFTFLCSVYNFRLRKLEKLYSIYEAEELLDAINKLIQDYHPLYEYSVPNQSLLGILSYEEHA